MAPTRLSPFPRPRADSSTARTFCTGQNNPQVSAPGARASKRTLDTCQLPRIPFQPSAIPATVPPPTTIAARVQRFISANPPAPEPPAPDIPVTRPTVAIARTVLTARMGATRWGSTMQRTGVRLAVATPPTRLTVRMWVARWVLTRRWSGASSVSQVTSQVRIAECVPTSSRSGALPRHHAMAQMWAVRCVSMRQRIGAALGSRAPPCRGIA